MIDYRSLLLDMRRPRLLVRAARLGLQEYRRDRDLKRLLGRIYPISPEATMAHLLSEEEQVEATRKEGDANYSIVRHIDLLIALMAEARLQRQA
jgi:Family of unknown function (DUF6477)